MNSKLKRMRLKFDNNLHYQKQAIASVVDLLKGQTRKQANFTVALQKQVSMDDLEQGYTDQAIGVANKLELIEDEILENLQEIQLRNGIGQTSVLLKNQYDIDIEMETGTGKTYVYLRSIFELNKNYGFTKFIIVVPSIAIKEGVKKSIEIMTDEFKGLYDNVIFNHFVYDSSQLEQVRSFAVSDNIEIMVINIDAFRKSFDDPEKINKSNIIHRENDKLNGLKPIELIKETRPIVIIDEPQSVDTTPKSKEAICSLNPLCTLRYSATHVDKHNLVYKLDAVDAFDLELVKQIEVASFESKDCGKAYRRLGTHVAQAHDMTIKEYKERFGLCNNAKTTEANYSRMMHDYAYQYNMPEQLRTAGANTRIKPGETHLRLGKPTRLQENLAKRARRAS